MMKRNSTKAAILASALTFAAVGMNSAKAELVAYWNFDGSGGDNAADCAAGNDGRFAGNPTRVAGYLGRALRFDGAEDYVNCGGGKSPDEPNTWADMSGAITVSAWIRVAQFSKGFEAIIAKGDSAWRLARNNDRDTLEFGANGGPAMWLAQGAVNVNDGKWHHVVGVFDGSNASLYVDGKLDASLQTNVRIRSSNHDVYIGENSERTGRQWNGLIDEVALFDHAMHEDEIGRLHSMGAKSFLSNARRALVNACAEAEKAIERQGAAGAGAVVDKQIAAAEKLLKEDASEPGPTSRLLLARLYSMSARCREASGAPKAEVALAQRKSVLLSPQASGYVPGMLWLYANSSQDDYSAVAKESLAAVADKPDCMYRIARSFQFSAKWEPFRLFLDAALAGLNEPAACAKAVARALESDKTWASRFQEYCAGRQDLRPYAVDVFANSARECIEGDKYTEAINIYRRIVSICGGGDERMTYELKICECMFNSGDCTDAIAGLDAFIEKYRHIDRLVVMQAILLKGRAYLQLNEIDSASDVFLDLMVDYPETSKAPEANFFIGYCSMLQGNFAEAKETFELVIKDYPESSYASRAILCLRKIARMTN